MKLRSFFLLTFLFFYSFLYAQIQVSDATVLPYTPENLITNYFLGDGITVTSITYDGAPEAVGYFDKAKTAIGIQRGIVMTTGRAANDPDNNTKFGIANKGSIFASNDNFFGSFDPDIKKILPANSKSFNMARYTIKFIPTSDTLRFKYSFASEEYPEYSCSGFNDVFGFFISGPGITGPYTNNGKNIALIPGTNLPVSINNVHPTFSGGSPCPAKNGQYYVNNNASNIQPVYDGFTKVFTAEAVVIPCQEYTISLVISDVGDPVFDSGVFLEAKSFGTGPLKVQPLSVSLDGTIREGCADGKIVFSLSKKATEDYPIDQKVFGSATNGVDYLDIPTGLYIPAGDSALVVPIVAFDDGIKETNESIAFDVKIDICHRDTFYLYLQDNPIKAPQLGNDTLICKGGSVKLDATLPIPLPQPKTFTNKDSFFVNTVTPKFQNPPTTSQIDVAGIQPVTLQDGMIQSVCMNVKHKWIDEIDAYLIAPSGQFIELTTDNGGSGDNYTQTCFKPVSKNLISSGIPPFTNDFEPEGIWNDLWGAPKNPVNGAWKLQIIDDFPGLDGKLIDWSITFNPSYKLTYKWTPTTGLSCSDCPTPTATPTKTTTYTVEAYDTYGCPVVDSITIFVYDSLPAPKVLCGIVTHESVQFTWNPILFAQGYEVSINGGPWITPTNAFSHKITGLGLVQTVDIQVRAKGECGGKIGKQSCQTLNCSTPTPKFDNLANISCFGEKDGTVKLSATGGLPPYTFKLGTESNNTGFFDKLSAGNYTVSVVESATCVSIVKFEILEPQKLKFTYGADSVTCFGGEDAAAVLDIQGGTKPFKYQWSNGITDSIAFSLKAFNYKITVTDANSCFVVDSIKIHQPAEIFLDKIVEDVACYGLPYGSARIIPKGGETPYYYKWDTNTGLQIAPKAVKLVPGKHYVTVTDNRGCVVKTFVEIKSPNEVELSLKRVNTSCFGKKDGQVQVSAKGGLAPYKFEWNDPTKSKDTLIKNLPSGFYKVKVTDKNGCEVTDSIEVKTPDSLKLSITNQNIRCYGKKDAQAEVIIAGGTSPYIYAWSNGQNGSNKIIDLATGFYTVTVVDFRNCIQTAKTEITEADSIKLDFVIKATDCNGAATGSIALTPSGGNPPYLYDWTGPDGFTSTNEDLTNLKSGNYILKIKDVFNCEKTKTIKVTEPNPVVIKPILTNVKCKGEKTGKIELGITGGTTPYKFLWDNGATTKDLNLIAANVYEITVTDALGCNYIESHEIIEPNTALSSVINVSDTLCFGEKGVIKVTASGGTLPYDFVWSNNLTTPEITDQTAGTYYVSVTDGNKCFLKDTAILAQLGKVSLKLSQTAASCFEFKDGKAQVDEVLYGSTKAAIAGFNYLWNNATNQPSTDKLNGGQTYTVLATDKRGCSATSNIKIQQPDPIKVIATKTIQPLCFGNANGELTVKGEGGNPPYNFVWDAKANNQIGDKATGLKEGIYDVTVSDNKGCANNVQIPLSQPKNLSASFLVKNLACPQTPTGAIEAFGVGGTQPYTFKWNNNSDKNLINNLLSNTYKITITDANGCQKDTSVFVGQPTPLDLQIQKTDVTCAGDRDGTFKAVVKGGTPPFTFSFNNQNFNGQNSYTGLKPDLYSIIIKDKNNCTFAEDIVINEPLPITVDLGKDSTILYGDTVRLNPIIKDTIGKANLLWTPYNPTYLTCETCLYPTAKPVTSTLYTLQVTDNKGCIGIGTVNLFIKINDEIHVPTAFTPNDDGKNDLLLIHGENGGKVLNFTVYDRWGELLYEHENSDVNDDKIGWNGTFRGVNSATGTYVWKAFVQLKNGEKRNFKGSTTLLR